jgi:hypothetical protein
MKNCWAACLGSTYEPCENHIDLKLRLHTKGEWNDQRGYWLRYGVIGIVAVANHIFSKIDIIEFEISVQFPFVVNVMAIKAQVEAMIVGQ